MSKFCADCGNQAPIHAHDCRRVRRAFHPRRWTLGSAFQYAADHVHGCNADAIGAEQAALGNVSGAAPSVQVGERRTYFASYD